MGRDYHKWAGGAASALLVLLSGCGGGGAGGGSTVTPGPVNHAPTITSAGSASFAENATSAVYTLTASDPDGDPVTFSVAGGADAALFTLSGGTLAFIKPPNFDQPTDADANNSYEISLSATDGKGGTVTMALSVKVTNDREGVTMTRVATALGVDAVITARRNASGLIVVSQDGTVRLVDADTGAVSNSGTAFATGETGRVLATAHFNGLSVAMLDIAGRGVIVRAVPVTSASLQNISEATLAPASTLAPRGALFIGGDGFMFGAVGDPQGTLAQDPASGFGKFYRVQVDPYCGASVGPVCIYGERFGDGVHAPAGGGGYQQRSFLLDRGTDKQEEIDYFNQASNPIDFGWPFREGTFERVANPPAVVNGPSLTYPHGTGFFEGQGLTGGVYYTGPIASLNDKVLVTDEVGKVFAFPASFLTDGLVHSAREMENRTADFVPTTGAIERPVAIVRDFAGRLFVLDSDGELYATS